MIEKHLRRKAKSKNGEKMGIFDSKSETVEPITCATAPAQEKSQSVVKDGSGNWPVTRRVKASEVVMRHSTDKEARPTSRTAPSEECGKFKSANSKAIELLSSTVLLSTSSPFSPSSNAVGGKEITANKKLMAEDFGAQFTR